MEPLLHAQRVSRDCVDFASAEAKLAGGGAFPHRCGFRLVGMGLRTALWQNYWCRCARPNLATIERHGMRRDDGHRLGATE
jgi:hypothetical protein